MNHVRGIIMLAAGAFALFEGWKMHAAGKPSWAAFVLGVLAIAVGIWRLTRNSSRPLK